MQYTGKLCELITEAAINDIDLSTMVLALMAADKWEIARQAARIQKLLQPEHDIITLMDAWKMTLNLYGES